MAKHDKEFTDSSPLDDIKKANDTKLLGNASFGVFGPNPFGPSVPFGGLQGPSGDFGGSTLSGLGGGTFLNIDFGGLGDAFIADLLDLISFLQSDIEKTGNTESTKPFQNAIDRWTELLNDYQNGDATLEDLKNFDAGVLADMPSWSDYFNDLISGEEGVVLGYPDSTGEGGDEGVILPPLLPPLPTDDDDDGDDDAGGGGGGGGEEGGEAGASDDGGSDDGGGDTGGDDGSTDSGGGNLDQGDGEGEESTPQYYEVDENGNVFIVDGDDEDGFWDENGFWNGAWKRIGNINDGTGAWWEDFFESGGIYGEHGELIIRPESDPDPDSDDDDDDDDDTTDLTPDPDLFGGGEPTDPGPPITGGPNPPSVNDGDGKVPLTLTLILVTLKQVVPSLLAGMEVVATELLMMALTLVVAVMIPAAAVAAVMAAAVVAVAAEMALVVVMAPVAMVPVVTVTAVMALAMALVVTVVAMV